MLPLYAARIEDLGVGDFVKADCAACHHVAPLTPEILLSVGLSPGAKVLDIRGGSGVAGAAGRGGPWSPAQGTGRRRSARRFFADLWRTSQVTAGAALT